MNVNRRRFIGAAIAASAGLAAPRAFAAPRASDMPRLLPKAMAALNSHYSAIPRRDKIGIVDFASHSGEQRMFVVDVGNGRVLSSYLVAHGRGSDPANTGFVQRFSNRPGSNASSDGSYLTGDIYRGKHGRSRRLHGLDPENSSAFDRAIVMHGADYVDRDLVRVQGHIGRSLGCFAVQQDRIGDLLEQLGDDRLLFASK